MSRHRVAAGLRLPCPGVWSPAPASPRARRPRIDLEDPAQKLEAFIRANGDTSGNPVATYGTARSTAMCRARSRAPLFGLEVVGMSRYEKIDGGYLRLHREIGYYTDLKTGEVIRRWFNPWLQREVEVIPIQNDPVNRRYTVQNTNYSFERLRRRHRLLPRGAAALSEPARPRDLSAELERRFLRGDGDVHDLHPPRPARGSAG